MLLKLHIIFSVLLIKREILFAMVPDISVAKNSEEWRCVCLKRSVRMFFRIKISIRYSKKVRMPSVMLLPKWSAA